MRSITISKIHGREILDSRGNPTVEAEVTSGDLVTPFKVVASVPSGASTGSREALELRDEDAKRYLGKGVLKAVSHINNEIQNKFKNHKFHSLHEVDSALLTLDGTPNKSKLGANAMLAVSLACAKVFAAVNGMELYEYLRKVSHTAHYSLPVPMMNIINGGAHADNNLGIQEFMILPVGAPTFTEALRYGAEVFHTLKKLLHKKGLSTAVGDEGGFAPNLPSHAAAIEMIIEAIKQSGYQPGRDIYLGLDVASSELYRDGHYQLEKEKLTSAEMVDYLEKLVSEYPIISIEDGMAESDWAGWELLTKRLGKKIELVGDDVFVTNTAIFKEGIAKHVANAILIKPNQIGTMTETLAAITMAKQADYAVVISHRSGETEDATIADLSVGTAAGQIKTGSLSRMDRIAKYNRLLRIEELLGPQAQYAGRQAFSKLV